MKGTIKRSKSQEFLNRGDKSFKATPKKPKWMKGKKDNNKATPKKPEWMKGKKPV
jgi:hypothetical protein